MKVNTKAFKKATLNNYQIQLMSEQIANISRAFQLKHERIVHPELAFAKPIVDEWCNEAIETSLLANDCDRLFCLKQAETLNLLAHGVNVAISSIVNTAGDIAMSGCNFLGRAFFDPVYGANTITTEFINCATNLASIFIEGANFTHDIQTLPIKLIFDPEGAKSIVEHRYAQVEACKAAISTWYENWCHKSCDERISQVFAGGTKIVINFIVARRIDSFLTRTLSKASNTLKLIKNSCTAAEIENILATTPEGFNLKVASEMYNEMQFAAEMEKLALSGAERIKVANMYEFFGKTKFGERLKKVSVATSKIEQGEKVFRVAEKVPRFLDKGDYFYLDRTHLDHLEVFNGRGKFKKALWLDGTVNESATNGGFGRSIDI